MPACDPGFGLQFFLCGLMSKMNTVKQVFALLIEKKAWWLIPMVAVFLLLGLLIVLTQGSALSPFIYTLF